MKCEKCGNEFDGKFCTKCGEKAPEKEATVSESTASPDKKKKGAKIVIAAVLAVIYTALILFGSVLISTKYLEKEAKSLIKEKYSDSDKKDKKDKDEKDGYYTYTSSSDSQTEDEPTLNGSDLKIIEGSGSFNSAYYEYSFVIKNNTDYEFKYINVVCSICDKDGTILGTTTGGLNVTLAPGETGTLKGYINDKEDLSGASYIIANKFDGDEKGYLYPDKKNAQETKIVI